MLKEAGLFTKISKYEFFKTKIIFLGIIVSYDGLYINLTKIETIKN